MNSGELMVGDLVQSYGKVIKVEEILKDGINPMWDFNENYGCEVDNADLQPIPLTPEILDTNFEEKGIEGFYQRHNLVPYVVDVSDVDIPNEFISKWNFVWDEVGKYLTIEDDPLIKIRYVHELQHALRLCGLNELADNFKI